MFEKSRCRAYCLNVKYILILLVIVVILLVAVLAFMFGKFGFKFSLGRVPSVSPSVESNVVGSELPQASAIVASPNPSPSVVLSKKVTGGGILSFPKYQLSVPIDWMDSKQSGGPDDQKLILKKGDFEISITQGGFGGAVCLFPGDGGVEGPSTKYSAFKEITTQSGDLLRRAWNGEEVAANGYGLCHKSEFGWGVPTVYGHVSLKTPVVKGRAMVDEMDVILASLKKI